MPAPSGDSQTASQRITSQIAELGDWRGELLARLRQIILAADPEITEEWKWGSAVWAADGLVCSAGPFKDHVKLNFFQGATLADPRHLFNAGLDAKATRAIDFKQGERVDEPAVRELVQAAVAYNRSAKKKK